MGKVQFDAILKEVGKYGRYQLYVAVLTGLGALLIGMQTLANVFISGVPDYWCGGEDRPDLNASHTIVSLRANHSQCGVTPEEVGNQTDSTEDSMCQNYMYDESVYGSTVVSKWDLVCSSGWQVAMGQSTYMLGFAVGSITLGNWADIIGRKSVWLISMSLVLCGAVGAAFMPSYWLFIAFRSLIGLGAAGVLTTGFVLAMELTGSAGRLWGCVVYQGFFALGYMILPGIAYFIRDYRYLQLITGLIPLLFLPYIWIFDESPRWLMTKHKYMKAAAIIKKAAKMNKKDCPEQVLHFSKQNLIADEEEKAKQDEQGVDTSESYSIITVLKFPVLRWRTFNICFNWFANSFVYYGLSLASANLLGGPYINLFLSGLMEFPGFIICILTASRLGRRNILSGLLLMSGLSCVVIACLPEDEAIGRLVLSLLGKLCISGSFNLIYLFTSELFPTVIRNLLTGTGSTFARVGSSIAPFILLTGEHWAPMPMLSFGAVALASGIWTLVLPETLKQKLPDTLSEGEAFDSPPLIEVKWPCCKKSKTVTLE